MQPYSSFIFILLLLILTFDFGHGADMKFRNEVLKAHNEYRSKHGVPAMTLDDDATKTAQTWAQYLADNEVLDSSNASQRNQAGENVYQGTGTISGDEPVNEWYGEIKKYDFPSSSGISDKTRHFTQLIWKKSTKLGVGMATSKSGKVYVVAHYIPVGNVVGHFETNVLPEVSTTTPKEK